MAQLNSIRLETSRLYLIPLNYDQLLKYANLDYSLESELGLFPRKRELTEEFVSVLKKYLIPYAGYNPEHILFATVWVIIHKEKKVIIGDIGFNAAPSKQGTIEVGYSTYPDFMNNGFMTEALMAMAKWAFHQSDVKIIIAQTDKGNLATHKVLQKNHFSPFAEAEMFYWWRLDRDVFETIIN